MMESHRGRSSSAGHQPNQRISLSPSPHNFHNQSSPTDQSTTSANFNLQSFNTNISPTSESGLQYNNLPTSYLNGAVQPPQFQQQHILPSNDYSDRSFGQSYQQNGLESTFQQETSHMNGHQANQQHQQDALGLNQNFDAYSQQQPDFIGKQGQSFENNFMLDPQLDTDQQPQGHINPQDIMSDMSSPQNMVPTPPNLMPPSGHSSGPTSPVTSQGHQWSPNHSRNASASLDPSSAAFTNGQAQTEWAGMQFQTHRRVPSDARSDVSSSAAPSPFLAQQESFEQFEPSPSPMMHPQPDPQIFNDGLGIGNFSISDNQPHVHSPRHSPFVSPRMSPQPGLGLAQEASFMPLQNQNNGFNGVSGPQMYSSEAFPQFEPGERLGSNDMGQSTQMAPPEINVQLAPSTQQPGFDPSPRSEHDFDALTPPDNRGRKNRMRAKSDTYISRPVTPASNAATLGSNDSSDRRRSLSPGYGGAFSPNISRESSPAPRTSPSRRSSTNSIPNRDYILELADPNRPPVSGNDKRVQKHPATFQCTLCPKKFTRAYNLRSHLRTHTDERPFVCTVCGKAFARQHDRKRHEGLHSGEKKFVCRGELGTGGSWGCGRRFARADALGRHFRSEAGRVCIKPLLDEEAMERQRAYDEQMMNQSMQAGGMMSQPPMNGNMQNGGFAFPAAILAQFPQLQTIQWDQIPPGGDDDISGRSSFDASSGGEFYDEAEEGYVSGPGTAYAAGNSWDSQMDNRDWASDYEGR
ncbi:hypothetical protein OEA41_003258 [Lepraria neglecta]|uniref:C2H2-type domain-containing protein n=1 Tax=Lepraria neglecta TaxID=209136 RepID=A0AAE0DIQ7_9LECA|nr:hypothetical protein OEA41_003258 [Lepraria neglecta]